MLSLNELWFILVTVLFAGFFFLEGFDFGVGIVARFLGRDERERRMIINTIGPFWDANEVWLLTAGGALFAAFPDWYATLFSGFYLPLVLMLLALIARGVSFEFRSKLDHGGWKKAWDWTIFFGSLLPPLLWGVAFANVIRGVPIDGQKEYTGGFFELLNPYALLGGVALVLICVVHGLLFITLRTQGELRDRARGAARLTILAAGVVLLGFALLTGWATDIFSVHGYGMLALPAVGAVAMALAIYFLNKQRDGWAFGMTGLVILVSVITLFAGLFPRVMISSTDIAFNLTVHNASSGSYSLKIMSIVALTLLPFVLGYQIWSYYVFRKRIDETEHLEY